MALSCQVSLNVGAYAAGQTPPPQATITVYNPNAVAVVVTGLQLKARVLLDTGVNHLAMPPSVPPIGPGMTVSVPALGSITVGPFPIVVGSAANANQFQTVQQAGNQFPINPQGSQPAQYIVMVGAEVYGSDASLNIAGEAALFVSYTSLPPLGSQGGFLSWGAPGTNILNGLVLGVL